MFKKIATTLVVASLVFGSLFFSQKALAAHTTVSNAYLFNGSWVYSVTIHNPSNRRLYCTLSATNGAFYSGYIAPWSRSGRMRINDINATYNWSCS